MRIQVIASGRVVQLQAEFWPLANERSSPPRAVARDSLASCATASLALRCRHTLLPEVLFWSQFALSASLCQLPVAKHRSWPAFACTSSLVRLVCALSRLLAKQKSSPRTTRAACASMSHCYSHRNLPFANIVRKIRYWH